MGRVQSNTVSATTSPAAVSIYSPWFSTLSPFNYRSMTNQGGGVFTAAYAPGAAAVAAAIAGGMIIVALAPGAYAGNSVPSACSFGGVAGTVISYYDAGDNTTVVLLAFKLSPSMVGNTLSVTWSSQSTMKFDAFVAQNVGSTEAQVLASKVGFGGNSGAGATLSPPVGSLVATNNFGGTGSTFPSSSNGATYFLSNGSPFVIDSTFQGGYQIPSSSPVTYHSDGLTTYSVTLGVILHP